MKFIFTVFNKSKAYFILLISGWRSVEIFGTPKEIMGTYIVCLKNDAVMEFNYSNLNNDVRWWKIGVGDEHNDNPVKFWKLLPKPPLDIITHEK